MSKDAKKDEKKGGGGDAKKGGDGGKKGGDGAKKGGDGGKKGGDGGKKEDKKGGDAGKKGGDGGKKGGDASKKDAGAEVAKKADTAGKGAPAAAPAAVTPAATTAKGTDAGVKKEAKDAKKGGKDDDEEGGAEGGDGKAARGPFRRFFFRGHEVHKLLDLTHAELMKLMHARVRRRFGRGHIPMNLLRKLRAAKKAAPEGEKPRTIKTHYRNMIILPEMVASIVGVYNGLSFTQVEIKPDMIGHYLGEFALSYKPVKHGRPGVGATGSSRFIPLK